MSEILRELVTHEILLGRALATRAWPRKVLDAHYGSFQRVTVKQVCVGPDEDDLCWIVIEPSVLFSGLGIDRYFTAGSCNVPSLDVVQELLARGVEVTIEHFINTQSDNDKEEA